MADAFSHPAAGNEHWYDRVDTQTELTWDQAKTDAETRFYEGVQGHLMTITSQEEADLRETLYTKTALPDAGKDRFWIGAYQPSGSPEPAGNWRWITGEPWGFTNWGGRRAKQPRRRRCSLFEHHQRTME